MKVSFVYSQEDLVDSTMRFLARSKTFRATNRKGLAVSALLYALVAVLVFQVFFKTLLFGVLLGLFMVLVIMALGPLFMEHSRRKNLARFYREKYGDEDQFLCEVELSAEGLAVRDQNTRQLNRWDEVEDIRVTKDSVDIFAKRGGVVVRNRAFDSPEMRREFVAVARKHLAPARQTR